MSTFQLKAKYIFSGHIEALSGLSIGGTFSPMSIGAPDSTVVRNPLNNKPYIPGSTLKGKLRCLLEQSEGTFSEDKKRDFHGPTVHPKYLATRLFGGGGKIGVIQYSRPSRIVVRDCLLSESLSIGRFDNCDLPYTEVKTEVAIDRVTSTTQGMLRQIERVPAGAVFEFSIVLNIFDGVASADHLDPLRADSDVELLNGFIQSLSLLQDDYLGGKGSRGSGQVDIKIEQVIERSAAYYRGEADEKVVTHQLPGGVTIPENLLASKA